MNRDINNQIQTLLKLFEDNLLVFLDTQMTKLKDDIVKLVNESI